MISQLTYTNRSGLPVYRLTRDGVDVLSAKLSLSFVGIKADISKRDTPYCVMDMTRLPEFRPQNNLCNIKRILPTVLYNGMGEKVGGVEAQKGKGYIYFECTVAEYNFDAYVVVLDKEVLKVSIYNSGVQVALIEDAGPQPTDGFVYTITSVDELTAEMAAIFGIFFDINSYIPIGEFEFSHRSRRFDITNNAALAQKYDVDFTLSLDNNRFIGSFENSEYMKDNTTEIDLWELDLKLRKTPKRARREVKPAEPELQGAVPEVQEAAPEVQTGEPANKEPQTIGQVTEETEG